MRFFIVVVVVLLGIAALSKIIHFGSNHYPDKSVTSADVAAWALGIQLVLFIWGITLLVRS
jgi:hypothetical protein